MTNHQSYWDKEIEDAKLLVKENVPVTATAVLRLAMDSKNRHEKEVEELQEQNNRGIKLLRKEEAEYIAKLEKMVNNNNQKWQDLLDWIDKNSVMRIYIAKEDLKQKIKELKEK